MQRSTIFSGGNFLIGTLRLLQSQFGGQRDDAAQLGIELPKAFEINVGQPLRSDLASFDPVRQAGERCESNVFVVVRKRAGIGLLHTN